jgi:hypothetical protein
MFVNCNKHEYRSTRNIIKKKNRTDASSLSWRIPQSLRKKELPILSSAIFIHVCGPHAVNQLDIDIHKLSKLS